MIRLFLIAILSVNVMASDLFRETEDLCNKGSLISCVDLGIMYYTANQVKEDLKKSEKLFTKACRGRVANGCYYLGYLYKRGGEGILKDKKKAKLAFGRACNIGSEKSCIQFRQLEAKGI